MCTQPRRESPDAHNTVTRSPSATVASGHHRGRIGALRNNPNKAVKQPTVKTGSETLKERPVVYKTQIC